MGKLLDAIIAKLQELDQRKQEPAPDYSDPHAALNYINSRNAEEYERSALGKKLIGALRSLPKAARDRFYERCVLPAARQNFPKAKFDDCLDPESDNGKKLSLWILNSNNYGQNAQNAFQVLEEMLGQEAADELADEVENIVAPTNPAYPDEDKLVYPLTNELEEISKSLDPYSPDSIMDQQILYEVNEELAYVSDDVRELIDKTDKAIVGVVGYQSMVNRATYDMQNRFIRQELENGKYKDKFPTFPSSDATDQIFYAMDDAEVQENGPLTAQDVEDLQKLKPEISKGLKDDVIAVTDKMDKLGEAEYRNGYTVMRLQGGKPNEGLFTSEQGFKFYAYWPIYNARVKLEEAVKEKNMEKIREAHYRYKEVKQELDAMRNIVKKHPTGLSNGNLNSTRELPNGVINPLPLNHMEDFVGQSQLNGLFCLYALAKNIKSTPEKLLEDPIGVMTQAGRKQVEQYGLGSRKTTGEKLYWALSNTACDTNFPNDWSWKNGQLCGRGFDGVACLADDPKEQARIAGIGQLAIGAGTAYVNAHRREWRKLTQCSKEQQELLYRHALLLPEEEFKPLEYAAAFSKPDWKQQLDTNALIGRLKQEGKLDYGKLVDRVGEIITEAKTCDKNTDTKYSADGLIEASHKMFKEMIKNATQEERQTEGFRKMEAYAGRMLLDTAAFRRGQKQLFGFMDVQKQEKKGFFLSSENSEEQKKMVRSQNTFRFKVLQMQGKELPEGVSEEDKEYLKTITLKQAYDVARAATFDYCIKKTDKGSSRFFVHKTGADRLDAAEDSLKIMDKMADRLELRSPAQKLIDKARLEVYNDRRDDDWSADQTERAAAKIMYAMTLEHKGISPEEQKARLEPHRLEMGIAYIREQEAFQKMMRNEGASKVADYVAEGHGKLTDAYVRGMNSAAREQHREAGKDPNQMSYEEKTAVWKNQTLQM